MRKPFAYDSLFKFFKRAFLRFARVDRNNFLAIFLKEKRIPLKYREKFLYVFYNKNMSSGFLIAMLLFFVFYSPQIKALDKGAFFEYLDRTYGLSSSSVTAGGQDNDGFLWFATKGGLNRWDGYRMKVFQHEPFKKGTLSHNLIQTIYLDQDDLFWLGTYGGLNRFNPHTGTIKAYVHSERQANSLSQNVVVAIFRDSKKRLWVGTLDGLNLLDEKTNQFHIFRSNPDDPLSLSSSIIRSIGEDSFGRLWVGTYNGLDLWDEDEKVFRRASDLFPHLPAKTVMSILADDKGGLYLGVWGVGVVHFQPDLNKSRTWRLSDRRIYSLSYGEENQIYIGTWGDGLHVLNPSTSESFAFRHDPNKNFTLSHNVVYGTFTDRSGIVWIMTNGGGVNRYNPRFKQVKNYTSNNSELPSGKVTVIKQDSQGRIWIGIYNGGIVLMNKRKQIQRLFRHSKDNPTSLSNEVVHDISEDGLGRIWISTNDGVNLFDEKKQIFRRFVYHPSKKDLPGKAVYAILNDGNDDLWLVPYAKGLIRRKVLDRTDRPKVYRAGLGQMHALPDDFVSVLLKDSQGHLWIGTHGGLALYRPQTDDFLSWTYDPEQLDGLPSNSIYCLLEKSDAQIWIGSDGGLSLFDFKTGRFKNWGRQEGLTDLSVFGIEKDDKNLLWVTTSDGLFSFHFEKESFLRYGVEDGLLSTEFSAKPCYIDGELFLGSVRGLSIFRPKLSKSSSPAPKVVLTEIEVLDQPYAIHSPLVLDWWENSFRVQFAVLDFINPLRNQYSHKLEGFDSEWIKSRGSNLAVYTNLNSGEYTLRIKGANSDGIWSEMDPSLNIHIKPAPWFSWYAYFLYIVIFVVLLYLMQKIRMSGQLKKKIQELERIKLLLEEANHQLDQLSRMDSLTGIPNRRALDHWLEKEWAFSLRECKMISILMLDIDFFKRFNDHYGHIEGDICLKTVAAVIQKSLQRTTDFCARYGGEEFVVVLHDSDKEGAYLVASRILEAIDELAIPHKMSSTSCFVTVSIGIATRLPEISFSCQDLLQLADKALYRAKAAGRHRIEEAE